MEFQILEGKTGKEIPESSRLEFLETFSGNNFAWSDAEDNTFRPLNRGGIAHLPLLRTLLAIHFFTMSKTGYEDAVNFQNKIHSKLQKI